MTGEQLLAAVLADPDSDEARLVYGDYLLERGDPRGELIQLQLAQHRHRDDSGARRVRELLDRHAAAWCAPLSAALDPVSIEIERGFLSRCRTLDPVPREVIGHPLWHTVRDLATTDEQLIQHACLRNLEVIRTGIHGLRALTEARHESRIRCVVLDAAIEQPSRFRDPDPREEAAWAQVFAVGSLRGVRELVVQRGIDSYAPRTRELLASPLGRQLDVLEYWVDFARPAHWMDVLGNHAVRRLVLRFPGMSKVVFERDRQGIRPIFEIDGEGTHEEARDALLDLVSRCSTLEVVVAREHLDDVAPVLSELRALFDEVLVREPR